MPNIANKHTPGPWHVQDAYGTVLSPGGERIISCTEEVATGDADANARLIAAAPDLLAALAQIERLSREADGSLVDVRAMLGDIARAAISNVIGG